MCKSVVVKEKGTFISNQYFDKLQRNGLCIPADEVMYFFFHITAVFEEILNNKNYHKIFFSYKNQTRVLVSLAFKSIEENLIFIDLNRQCACGMTNNLIFKMACTSMSNLLLKNYSKHINDDKLKTMKEKSDKKKLNNYLVSCDIY